MKELALRFNTKVHISLCQYQLYKFVPSIQNWLTLDGESTKIHFCKPSSASANLKLPCKPGIPSPEMLTVIPTALFFTKNEVMPGRLVKAVSERSILCTLHLTKQLISFRVCSSKVLHPSFVRIKYTTWLCENFYFKYAQTSEYKHVKRFEYKVVERENKFNTRGKRKLHLEKISTNTPDYEYHSEPLGQQRRFVEGGVFEGKYSETAKTAEETNISIKKPDYDYHSEPLRQHKRFVESGKLEEKGSVRTEKLIHLLNNI